MFENLIESKPQRARTFKQTLFSLVLHVVLIYGAIKATAGAAEVLKEIIQDTTMVFLKAPEPPPPPPPTVVPPDAIVTANPPPMGFQTVMPPTEIPRDIPPVNLNERFDARDFSGKGVEGGIAAGIVGGTGPVSTEETFVADEVDDPVQPINQQRPRYPQYCSRRALRAVSTSNTWLAPTGRPSRSRSRSFAARTRRSKIRLATPSSARPTGRHGFADSRCVSWCSSECRSRSAGNTFCRRGIPVRTTEPGSSILPRHARGSIPWV